MFLWGFLFSTQAILAQNLLTDGSFSTTTTITPYYTGAEPQNTWCSWLDYSTNVTTEVTADGVCKYNITYGSYMGYFVQLVQWGFTLDQDFTYRLTFDIKADAVRNFGVFIGENHGNWFNLNGANYSQQANTNWQTKTIYFDATRAFSSYKLDFEMGGTNGTFYLDNIKLEKMGPMPTPKIEIIGSAVPPYNWSSGVDMATTDGLHYTLTNYVLPDGELKFRQNQDWTINWGSSAFPTGTAYQDGPNIPVSHGTYDISFNRHTGEYVFHCLDCPPAIGIIGSAVPPYNWSSDVKMKTTDGIHYTLNNFDLAGGELKFRQDDSWTFNWGGTNFPSGTATLNGPNIPVTAGNYNISFNRLTGDYFFQLNIPVISLIGSEGGWNTDVDMQTTDGINYTLLHHSFAQGEIKFRQDHNWSINWGSSNFPWGTGTQGGANIPIAAGMYDVYFHRPSGNYYFQIVCPDPVLNCPPNMEVTAEPGKCGATVFFNQPTPADYCGNPSVYQTGGLPSGYFFPVGTTTNSFVMFNETGKYAVCSFTVTVLDKEAPVITDVTVTPGMLWPANHKMVDGILTYKAWDNCGKVTTSLSISSNEPVNGTGDGDFAPDWNVLNDHTFQLRAERAANGKGRIYSLTLTAVDEAGNTSIQKMQVTVPHDAASITARSANQLVPMAPGELGSMRVTITPNLSASFFNLQIFSGAAERASVRVIDMSGRVMMSTTTASNQSVRFGDDLKPGVYMVEVSKGSNKTIQKIVKQ